MNGCFLCCFDDCLSGSSRAAYRNVVSNGVVKQRIGIARAFLHDSPLILMDEPTSNLDSLNEGIILKSLREASEKKTVVLVSHRKSTMNIVDTVFEMKDGRIS